MERSPLQLGLEGWLGLCWGWGGAGVEAEHVGTGRECWACGPVAWLAGYVVVGNSWGADRLGSVLGDPRMPASRQALFCSQ